MKKESQAHDRVKTDKRRTIDPRAGASQRLSSPEQWFQRGASENVARERPTLVRTSTRTCTSSGRDILRRNKVARPTQPLCVTVLKGAGSIAGLWRIEPQVLMSAQGHLLKHCMYVRARGGRLESTGVIALAWRMDVVNARGRCSDRCEAQVSPPSTRSSSKRQRFPVLAVAHVPRSFAQQPRRSGYECKDKDGVLHAASAWLLRQGALRTPSIIVIIVIVIIRIPQLLMPAQIQMPGDQLWPPSFCPGSSASFHSATTGSLPPCPWP